MSSDRTGSLPAEDPGLEQPADGSIDDLDDLDAELARLDRARPTAHQSAGGAPVELGWLLVVAGLLGIWASVSLVLSRIAIAADPDAELGCDLNPLIGCGDFITSWQASVFGWPNAVIGAIAFAALLTIGVLFLAGGTATTWFWRGLVAGAAGAVLWTLWFQYQAMASFRMLCPYCLVVWVVTIPVFVHVIARAAQGGHLPLGERLTRALVLDRWLIVAGWYVLLAAVIGVVFWSEWSLLLL